MESELLSLGRESVVYRKGDSVFKSYQPERSEFADLYKQHFASEEGLRPRPLVGALRTSYFHREARLLRAFSNLVPTVTPDFIRAYEQSLTIQTRYFPGPTMAERLSANPALTFEATQTMIRLLANLHSTCNKKLGYLIRNVKLIERPFKKEVNDRLRRHQAIIYAVSDEFGTYCSDNDLDLQSISDAKIRISLDNFIAQALNKEEFRYPVGEIVARNRRIIQAQNLVMEAKTSFVWAEANPKNLFCPSERASDNWVRAIDFPRAYLGGISDLASIIDNVYRLQSDGKAEVDSFDLATEYFRLIKAPFEQVPDMYAYTLAFRADELIRALANYCQKTPHEFSKLFGKKTFGQEKNGNLSNGNAKEEAKENFLNHLLEFISFFFDYYRAGSGEGWAMLEECRPSSEAQRLVKAQLRSMETILTDTGVKRGKILSQRRADRVRRLLNPES